MAATYFHLQERKAWIRTCTHTVVQDDDPDYARFCGHPDGTIQRVLRIWLAEGRRSGPFLRVYLGSVTLCRAGPSMRDLRRIFRRVAETPAGGGPSNKRLWPELSAMLRRLGREHHEALTFDPPRLSDRR